MGKFRCQALSGTSFLAVADPDATPVLAPDMEGDAQVEHHLARVPLVFLDQERGCVPGSGKPRPVIEHHLGPVVLGVVFPGSGQWFRKHAVVGGDVAVAVGKNEEDKPWVLFQVVVKQVPEGFIKTLIVLRMEFLGIGVRDGNVKGIENLCLA